MRSTVSSISELVTSSFTVAFPCSGLYCLRPATLRADEDLRFRCVSSFLTMLGLRYRFCALLLQLRLRLFLGALVHLPLPGDFSLCECCMANPHATKHFSYLRWRPNDSQHSVIHALAAHGAPGHSDPA